MLSCVAKSAEAHQRLFSRLTLGHPDFSGTVRNSFPGRRLSQYLSFSYRVYNGQGQLAGGHLPFPFPSPLVCSFPDLSTRDGLIHHSPLFSVDGLADETHFRAAEETSEMME